MPATRAPLEPTEWDQVQRVANSYKKALQTTSAVDLEHFLPTQARVRAWALVELVKLDLAFRWENGRGVLLDHYLEKFPDLGPPKELPAALVYEEYRLRHRHGDCPPLATYKARFPEQFAELQRLAREQPITGQEPTATPGPTAAPGPQILATGCFLDFGGGYTLLRRLGAGTFGEVWQARSAGGGFEVAIKVIFRPVEHQDARRELHALEVVRGLRHPFLLSTQSFWFLADRLYIVMELADQSLADRVQQCECQGTPGLPKPELLSCLRESSEALDYLHGKAVLHRDIKPENILLLQGHVKVGDFGLARLQENFRSATATTTGTPLYMPPEVWDGKVSEHSDQYSLAMTYAHLRLGKRPFATNNMLELMRCHMLRTPDLGDLPDSEKLAILRALAKDPQQRYPSCLEFTRAVEAAQVAAVAPIRQAVEVVPEPAVPPRAKEPHDYGTLCPPLTVPSLPVATRADVPAPPTQPELPVLPSGRRHRAAVALVLLLLLPPAAYVAWQWFAGPSPSPPLATLPRGCSRAEDAAVVTDRNKLKYYSRIYSHLPDGTRIPFVLVHAVGETDPPTFYIMQDKVSNDLYRKYDRATTCKDTPALLGCLAAPANAPLQGASLVMARFAERSDPNLPVFRVTAVEAHRFARWLGGLLPSVREWDKAAGRYETPRRQGPFRGVWEEIKANKADLDRVAVGRKALGPVPLDRDTLDVSPFGCRHMSGNGKEWTDTLADPQDRSVSEFANKEFPPGSLVMLRGRSYRASRPLLFSKLDEPNSAEVGARDPQDPDPEIGFRVVLHP
jgi:hypothetical protein